MANPNDTTKNLIPLDQRTKEEQRAIASKGGKASGEARRRKRDAKSAARLVLNLPTTEKATQLLEALGIEDEADHTNMVSVFAVAYMKAMKGDMRAVRILMEMSGMSPEFKLMEERHKKEMQERERANSAVDDWVNSIPDPEV